VVAVIYDVLIIGAGAAGMMAAIECGKRGKRVAILERAQKAGEKIRISGGGRCNFTNLYTKPSNFISQNPSFCISALRRYTPEQFISLIKLYGISYHEKKLGQLFCDNSSKQIINMLLMECQAVNVDFHFGIDIKKIEKLGNSFLTVSGIRTFESHSVVIASGGKSIPKMGATSFGYNVAKKFGIQIIPTEPALVPLTFDSAIGTQLKSLAGIAIDAIVRCGKNQFEEALLFTHRGLSGPAILQISSYWTAGMPINVDLLPENRIFEFLKGARHEKPRSGIYEILATLLPNRLVTAILMELNIQDQIGNATNKHFCALEERINRWQLIPSGSEGYRTAEVTRGGVDTRQLSSKTMESNDIPGLFFIGEVVDVTGNLGGFNFQWAWASGFAAGQYA
jgi:predicted Rossmann fold flavoprotein